MALALLVGVLLALLFQSPDEDSLDFYGVRHIMNTARMFYVFQSPDEDSLDFYRHPPLTRWRRLQ